MVVPTLYLMHKVACSMLFIYKVVATLYVRARSCNKLAWLYQQHVILRTPCDNLVTKHEEIAE